MFTLEYAKNPVRHDEHRISLTVKFAEFNEEHPFLATSFDPEPHGVAIYNRAVAGEFGAVAPYVEPTQT